MKRVALFILCLALLSAQAVAQGFVRLYYDSAKTQPKLFYQVSDTASNIAHGEYTSYFLSGRVQSKGRFQNNKPVGVWEFFYETGERKMTSAPMVQASDSTYRIYYYKNGRKNMEGPMRNEDRGGVWKAYSPDGALQSVVEYQYSADSARYTEYYPLGKILAQGMRLGQKNVGRWTYFAQSGVMSSEGYYDQDVKSGVWRYYYPSGALASTGTYQNDQRHGRWSYFFENGRVSARGPYLNDKRDGEWERFDDKNTLLSRGRFSRGEGQLVEYYPSGKKQAIGLVKGEKKEGLWLYFYEDGKKKGESSFNAGAGMYYGYYPNGVLQTKGRIKDDQRVGLWEIYNRAGTLSGYYRQLHDDAMPPSDTTALAGVLIKTDSVAASRPSLASERPLLRRKRSYFTPRFPEYRGLIVQFNPFFAFLGFLPASFEFYAQERIGYEFSFEVLRKPFFENENNIPQGQLFNRGYAIAIKQKFYNPISPLLMWYFGHEIVFTNLTHSVKAAAPGISTPVFAQASEVRGEYGPMVGLRLMQSVSRGGLTLEAYAGVVIGYRGFSMFSDQNTLFSGLKREPFAYTFRFGLNFGYTISAKR